MSDMGSSGDEDERDSQSGTGASNSPLPPSRRPRAVVIIDGQSATPLDYTVENNTHYQADTFKFKLAAQDPDFGLAYWDGAQPGLQIELKLGLLDDGAGVGDQPDDPTSLIVGQVDDVDIDIDSGEIEISGRDLTALLIDFKISQSWPNQTASQIVTMLAGMVGLTPQVTSTSTPVGQYEHSSYSAQSREVPAWDLVTSFADQEGFDAYVSGNTLYFGPPQDSSGTPFQITVDIQDGQPINLSTEKLSLKRSLTVAKNESVTVLSWGRQAKKVVKAVAKRGSGSSTGGSGNQNITIRRPNLTQEQAQQLAQKTLDDLSRHLRTFTAEAPDDPTVNAHMQASISGTNTQFDQTYYIDKVTHTFRWGECSMTLSGKNIPPSSEPSDAG